MFTAHIFRRHQCPELGWEWHNAISAGSREKVQALAHESIDGQIRRYLVPISRARFKIHIAKGDFDESEDARIAFLRKINLTFMDERANWPRLVEPVQEPAAGGKE